MRRLILSETLQRRYKAASYSDLIDRVSGTLASGKKGDADLWATMMDANRFWPAGNTLLAGVDPVRPNCCILPSVGDETLDTTVARAKRLWESRVGIGFDLSTCEHPADTLTELARACESVPMDHRPQRGNMSTLPISHPRALDFIKSKMHADGKSPLRYFNISVTTCDDRDMAAYETNLKIAAESAWSCGDPGVVFLDTIRSSTPYEYDQCAESWGPLSTVVPCGEQAMHPNETCSLGAVNLNADAHWTPNDDGDGARLNAQALSETVHEAVRVVDRALDVMDFCGDVDLELTSRTLRRIGVGVMGWADVIAQRLPGRQAAYGSPASLELARTVGATYKEAAANASASLDKGNITVTCIQPTGGIALLANLKGFAIEPDFEQATAVSPQAHIDMVAEWQRHVDNAVSKTINLPQDAKVDDVIAVFREARRRGLKLVSVYRDHTKSNQPMDLGGDDCQTC